MKKSFFAVGIILAVVVFAALFISSCESDSDNGSSDRPPSSGSLECSGNEVPNADETECTSCTGNQVSNADNTMCLECTGNQVPNGGNTMCMACTGIQVPSPDNSTCILCGTGLEPAPGNLECVGVPTFEERMYEFPVGPATNPCLSLYGDLHCGDPVPTSAEAGTVTATDGSGSSISYSVKSVNGESGSGNFAISNSGVLTVVTGADFILKSYALVVEAENAEGRSAEVNVTIKHAGTTTTDLVRGSGAEGNMITITDVEDTSACHKNTLNCISYTYTGSFGGIFYTAADDMPIDVSSFTNLVLSFKLSLTSSGSAPDREFFVLRVEDMDSGMTDGGGGTCGSVDPARAEAQGEGEYRVDRDDSGREFDGEWNTLTIPLMGTNNFNTPPGTLQSGFVANFQKCINPVDWTQIGGVVESSRMTVLGIWHPGADNILTVDEIYFK